MPNLANACFPEKATPGALEPASPLYYNDQPPEMIFIRHGALALGRRDEADAIFRSLVSYGETHSDDDVHMDYFAVSLPDFSSSIPTCGRATGFTASS
ncbi:MAG: hypothetical protein U0703_08220 [Anaerolineae bacterium]